MRELSLHILDVAQNAISIEASELIIEINECLTTNELIISIEDNGIGMDRETLKKVVDPFYTTRTTRKVGLGIPLFKASAERCGGTFEIWSEPNVGTKIKAVYPYQHIDRMPLGNIRDTIFSILMSCENMDLLYTHSFCGKTFVLDTKDVKKQLVDLPITSIEVLHWLKEYIDENIKRISL